jgi:hypothetical protein
MMVVAPLLIAFAVSSIPCPGALVSNASTFPGKCLRTFAQVSAVFPRADFGFRIATVLVIVAGILYLSAMTYRWHQTLWASIAAGWMLIAVSFTFNYCARTELVWLIIGQLIYFTYSRHHSRIRKFQL